MPITDRVIDLAGDDLSQLRTIKLPHLVKGGARAEFFVIVTPGAGIGSDGLRLAGSAIASAHYDFASPNNRPVKLIRRGILDCSDVGTGCEFVLLPLESVNSLN